MKKFLATLMILTLVLGVIGTTALAYDHVKAVASPTYVRTGPGLAYAIVDSLYAGNYYTWAGNISYDNRGIAWYDVYYSGGYGWVSSLHGNLVDYYGNSHNNTDISLGNGTSIMATGSVNVRTGPGLGYGTIGTMYAGQTTDFTGYKQHDERGVLWYQVNYYNQTGWVSSTYSRIY